MTKFILITASLFVGSFAYSMPVDSSLIYHEKGVVEMAARRFSVAAAFFDKAVQLNPRMTDAWLRNGYANLEMRKTDVARGHFTRVNELDPSNQAATKELASLYYDYRQFAKAIEFSKKCTSCENSAKIIAMSSYHLEDYAAAVKGLQKVVEKDPADAEATYTLGRAYLDMEDYKAAVPWYTRAIALEPKKNTWVYELGLLYYNQNDFKNAVNLFTRANAAGYPQSSDYLENLGYAYIYSGEFEKGEKLLLAVLEKKPGSKDILRDIALAYYQQKQFDKSLEFCQKLLESDSKDAAALYQAGLCFQKKGQKDKGQGMCDKAIEMDPSLASKRQKNMSMGL
jgi:tetratricopeptide (TPR) repeat protein